MIKKLVIGVMLTLFALVGTMTPANAGWSPPPNFDSVYTQEAVDELATSTFQATSGGPCWEWHKTWTQKNPYGDVQYKPHYDVVWCANTAKTKVVSPFTHNCSNVGGYATYDGCTKWRGPLGYASVPVQIEWKYRMCVPPYCVNRTASLTARVYPNGVIKGTFYYQ
jgi:hypothetical protein